MRMILYVQGLYSNYIYRPGAHRIPNYLLNNFCPLRFKKMSVFSLSILDGPQYKVVSSSDILLNVIDERRCYLVGYLKLRLVANEY